MLFTKFVPTDIILHEFVESEKETV
jgi:hypothetical protein